MVMHLCWVVMANFKFSQRCSICFSDRSSSFIPAFLRLKDPVPSMHCALALGCVEKGYLLNGCHKVLSAELLRMTVNMCAVKYMSVGMSYN